MSIVVFKNGILAADSVTMCGATQYRAPKVFPYRDSNNQMGAFGYVGMPSAAQDLMRAYLAGGENAYKAELQRLKDIDEEHSATVIIVPTHAKYILTAASKESLMRTPIQDMAFGYPEGVSFAQFMFQDPGRTWTADQVVARVIAMQSHSNECYVREPVVKYDLGTFTHDLLDRWMEDPIDGQFILSRPVEPA